jgi:predicted ABC-type ATPase
METCQSVKKPEIHVLCGSLGAGKTTVLRRMLPDNILFDDPHEIIAKYVERVGLNPENITKVGQDRLIGYIAGYQRGQFSHWLELKQDFATEAFLFAGSALLLMEAKEKGYKTHFWFIALDDYHLNYERSVKERYKLAFFDIPAETIFKDYGFALQKLDTYISLADESRIYDNSEFQNIGEAPPKEPKLILHVRDGKIVAKAGKIPRWAKDHISLLSRQYTGGKGIFEIKNNKTGEVEQIAEIQIPRNAYPAGFGMAICGMIAGVSIGSGSSDALNQEEGTKVTLLPNLERLILTIVNRYGVSLKKEEDYTYRFTFTPTGEETGIVQAQSLIHVTVTSKFQEEECFNGTFVEFSRYCVEDAAKIVIGHSEPDAQKN